jgi:hypothetical protein
MVPSFMGVILAAVAGCDSGTGPAADSPEVKAQQEANRKKNEEADAKISADLKKRNQRAPTVKQIGKPGAVGQ